MRAVRWLFAVVFALGSQGVAWAGEGQYSHDTDPPVWKSLRGETRVYDETCTPREYPLIDVKLELDVEEASPMTAEVRYRRVDVPGQWQRVLTPVTGNEVRFTMHEPVTAGRFELSIVLLDAAGNRSEPRTKSFWTAGWPNPKFEYGGGFEAPESVKLEPMVKQPSPMLGAGVLGGSLLAILGLVAVARRRG